MLYFESLSQKHSANLQTVSPHFLQKNNHLFSGHSLFPFCSTPQVCIPILLDKNWMLIWTNWQNAGNMWQNIWGARVTKCRFIQPISHYSVLNSYLKMWHLYRNSSFRNLVICNFLQWTSMMTNDSLNGDKRQCWQTSNMTGGISLW